MRISHLRRNVELKAKDLDPARSRAVCAELGAEDRGVLSQRDTYFRTPNGRLKLREEGGPPAELIAYARADLPAERESAYRIAEIPQPEELRLALAETLGTEIVVAKRRQLFLWKNVRTTSTRSRDWAASSSSRPSPTPSPISPKSSGRSRLSATPSASRSQAWSPRATPTWSARRARRPAEPEAPVERGAPVEVAGYPQPVAGAPQLNRS